MLGEARIAPVVIVMVSAVLMAAGWSASSLAQDESEYFRRDRSVSVTERPRDEFVSPGVRQGSFIVKPTVTLGVEADNNVFATDTNTQSDVIGIFRPSLEAESDWSRHGLAFEASATRREYADFSDESHWDGRIAADGHIDVRRGVFFEAGASAAWLTEPRTAAGAAFLAAEPVQYDTSNLFGRGTFTTGRLRFMAGVDVTRFDFDDAVLVGGAIADQDFRDHDEVEFTGRLDHAVSPSTSIFARGRVNTRSYDQAPVLPTLDRDSDGYTIDAGADFDVGGVARGHVAIGYTEQDYDGAAFPDVSGLSADAVVEWFPTQLTTLSATASRSIEDAAIAGSGAYVDTTAGVQVDHELLRNLILTGRAQISSDEYEGIDRNDDQVELMASASWLMNPQVGLRASYVHLDQDSSGLAARPDFDRDTFQVSIQVRF